MLVGSSAVRDERPRREFKCGKKAVRLRETGSARGVGMSLW